MKGRNIMNISLQRLKELEAIPEDAIDTDHIPELDESFWSKAKMVTPQTKKAISLRVDRVHQQNKIY